MILKIEVAPGELIDKISILEIKLERLTDPAKLRNVRHEHQALAQALAAGVPRSPAVTALRAELKAVNETIWQVEDDIRDHGESSVEIHCSLTRFGSRNAHKKALVAT